MSRLICEKCDQELDPKTIVANNVYNCSKCGLVEVIQSKDLSTHQNNKESDKPKYYLNEERTVFLTLSGDTATIEGKGKIGLHLFWELRREISLREYNIEIKENIQLPDDCSELFKFFEKEIIIDPSIDTSNVKSMACMFNQATLANPDVSNWCVSNVRSMHGMFSYTTKANPDVSKWDVSNVVSMGGMFHGAMSANPDVSKWDVSYGTDTFKMFDDCAYTGKLL